MVNEAKLSTIRNRFNAIVILQLWCHIKNLDQNYVVVVFVVADDVVQL